LRTILKYALAILLLLVLAFAAAVLYGKAQWQNSTADIRAGMNSARQPPTAARFDMRELAGLPAPVQRYFRAVLKDGQPLIVAAHLRQQGEFLVDEGKRTWGPFTATQLVTPSPPAFDWDARIDMAPGFTAFVRDGFAGGSGILHASAFGLVTLVDQRGTPELARGELMRYLAEGPWFPTALLPRHGVRWTGIDAAAARATLTLGATSVSLDFHFGADGLVDFVRSDARPRDVKGIPTPTPWQGRWRNYAERGGMRIPLDAEVEWILADGPLPYFRGHVSEIAYEFALR
jgi:hypothetical protein